MLPVAVPLENVAGTLLGRPGAVSGAASPVPVICAVEMLNATLPPGTTPSDLGVIESAKSLVVTGWTICKRTLAVCTREPAVPLNATTTSVAGEAAPHPFQLTPGSPPRGPPHTKPVTPPCTPP